MLHSLLANFFLSMGFKGLVALLLLFDPGQIVLCACFECLLILRKKAQKLFYNLKKNKKKTELCLN